MIFYRKTSNILNWLEWISNQVLEITFLTFLENGGSYTISTDISGHPKRLHYKSSGGLLGTIQSQQKRIWYQRNDYFLYYPSQGLFRIDEFPGSLQTKNNRKKLSNWFIKMTCWILVSISNEQCFWSFHNISSATCGQIITLKIQITPTSCPLRLWSMKNSEKLSPLGTVFKMTQNSFHIFSSRWWECF